MNDEIIPWYEVEPPGTYRAAGIRLWLAVRALKVALVESLPVFLSRHITSMPFWELKL